MADDAVPTSAGALLRQAREAQGLHIAALAAALKVPVRKLEALERDRHDELPDATFTRALAQTVCRALKVDAGPVLALLPRADAAALDQVAGGINAPFRDKSTASEPALGGLLRHPATAIVLLLGAAALALVLWPRSPTPSTVPVEPAVPIVPPAASAPLPAASAASVPTTLTNPPAPAASEAMVETVHAAPQLVAASSALLPAAGAPGLLTLRTREASWIEVVDAGNRPLLSRTVLPGETVGLDGRLPLRVTVGNAAATELSFRGQPVNLVAGTRDNVARLELK